MADEPPEFRLKTKFRYVQGLIPALSDLRITYADETEREKKNLIHRIVDCEGGGSFIVAGYRGVGKTCLVDAILDETENSIKDKRKPLFIRLNLARSLSSFELIRLIIRSVYEQVCGTDRDESKNAPAAYEQNLETIRKIYSRTIFSLKRSSIDATRVISYNKTTHSAEGGIRAIIGLLSGRFGAKYSKERRKDDETSKNIAEELSYLDYDEKTAESDLIEILRLTKRQMGYLPVVVLDELDKLDSKKPNDSTDDSLVMPVLSSLKNVFLSSGVVFLVIVGKDFYDEWVRERREEDSLLDSVFAHGVYVSKEWDIAEKILETNVDRFDSQRVALTNFSHYLDFMARGVLRRAINEFNRFVVWKGTDPFLTVDPAAQRRIIFYASLQSLLKENIEQIIRKTAETDVPPRRMDRLKYILYEATDKLIEHGRVIPNEAILDFQTRFPEEAKTVVSLFGELTQVLIENGWIQAEAEQLTLAKNREIEKAGFEGRKESLERRERIEAQKEAESIRLADEAEWELESAWKDEKRPVNIDSIYEKVKESIEKNPANTKAAELLDRIKQYV